MSSIVHNLVSHPVVKQPKGIATMWLAVAAFILSVIGVAVFGWDIFGDGKIHQENASSAILLAAFITFAAFFLFVIERLRPPYPTRR